MENIVENFEWAKCIGAGLAAFGMFGVGIGIGNLWSSYFLAISRNPSCKEVIGPSIWIAFAVTEAIALFGLLVALILLFVK